MDVVPPWLELVADSPHEVAFDSPVVDVECALAETHYVVILEEIRVHSAGAVLNDGVVTRLLLAILSIGSELSGGAIEVDSLFGEVGCGALDTLASSSRIDIGVGIVETTEPKSANISGKRPLSNPDVVLDIKGSAHGTTIAIAVSADIIVMTPPGVVLMSVHDYIVPTVFIGEHVVPVAGTEVERIVEHELEAGLLLLHHLLDITIELLEKSMVSAPPWLIDGLNSVKSFMITPLGKNTLDSILGPSDVVGVRVLVVLAVVSSRSLVIDTHPFTIGLIPMVEVVLILPDGSV